MIKTTIVMIEKVKDIPLPRNGRAIGAYKYRPLLENWSQMPSGTKFRIKSGMLSKNLYGILRAEARKWKVGNLMFHQRQNLLFGEVR